MPNQRSAYMRGQEERFPAAKTERRAEDRLVALGPDHSTFEVMAA